MTGQFLRGHLLGAPTARADALLAAIKVVVAGAEQWWSKHSPRAIQHHARYIIDRWQNIRQLGVS